MQPPHDAADGGVQPSGVAPMPPTAPVAPTAPPAPEMTVPEAPATAIPDGGPVAVNPTSIAPAPPTGGGLPPTTEGPADYSHLPPPPASDAQPQVLPPMFAPVPQIGAPHEPAPAPEALPPGFGAVPGTPSGFGANSPRIGDPDVVTNIVAQDGSVIDKELYDEPSAAVRTTASALAALAFIVATVVMIALLGFGLTRGIEEAAGRGWLGFVGNNAAPARPFAANDAAAVEAVAPTTFAGYSRTPIPLPIPWVAPILPINASWLLTNQFGAKATVTIGATGGDENGEPIARRLTGVVPGSGPGWSGFGYEGVDGVEVARAQRKEAPADQAKGVYDTIYAYSPYKGIAMVVQCDTDEVCRDVIRITIEETRKRRLAAASTAQNSPPPSP